MTDLDSAMNEVLTTRLTADGIYRLWLMGQPVDQQLLDARRDYQAAIKRRDEAAQVPTLAVIK